MGDTRRRSIAVAVAVVAPVVALLSAGPVAAQSDRYPPAPVDYDEDVEQRSAFWDQVVDPNRERYYAGVDRARELLARRDDSLLPEVEDLLRRSIELSPENPVAHWLRGELERRRENWQACAEAYGQLSAVHPNYEPTDYVPSGSKAAWALDYSLASCLAHAGRYEQAIVHYKHILSRGHSGEAIVHRGLGEVYMALGRLAEAITSLSTALRIRSNDLRANYDLAVAYDRDEKEALAAEYLQEARKHDSNLTHLKAPDISFVPPADEYYYLGLASAHGGEVEWAIAYLRRYLHASPKSPWARRVRHHLDHLERQPLTAAIIEVSGSGNVDRDKLTAAIGKAGHTLQACLDSTPDLLLTVTITTVGPESRSRRRAAQPQEPAGVSANPEYVFVSKPEAIARARHCVETAAGKIRVPFASRRSSRYATVKFSIIAR